jgi:cytochrome b involved in lipid metabolism
MNESTNFDLLTAGFASERSGMWHSLEAYLDTDATAALTMSGKPNRDLASLYEFEKDRIVARIADETVAEIPEGEVTRHNDPWNSRGAWVVVNGFVYNVTGRRSCTSVNPMPLPRLTY